MNPSTTMLSNGNTLEQVLHKEGIRLMECIQQELDNYYSSYSPKEYRRTEMLKNSLRIEPVKHEGKSISVRIYFDDILATHNSVMGGKPGFTPLLINDGWSWRNPNKGAYRFSHYEGYNFVEKGIEKYNKNNVYGFKITVEKKYGSWSETTEY